MGKNPPSTVHRGTTGIFEGQPRFKDSKGGVVPGALGRKKKDGLLKKNQALIGDSLLSTKGRNQ